MHFRQQIGLMLLNRTASQFHCTGNCIPLQALCTIHLRPEKQSSYLCKAANGCRKLFSGNRYLQSKNASWEIPALAFFRQIGLVADGDKTRTGINPSRCR